MGEVFATIPEEQAKVAELAAAGRLGVIHLALARGTVFIETFADDADAAAAVVATLPMAKWWDSDVFPLGAPPTTAGR